MESLTEFARVLIFDKRGTGLSDSVRGVPTLDARMDDARAVMDAVGSARAVLHATQLLDLEIRVGVHTGEFERLGDKLSGIAVSTAARTCSAAHPGEILVSSTVRDLVAGSGVGFKDRGVHALKGVPGEWRLFAVTP